MSSSGRSYRKKTKPAPTIRTKTIAPTQTACSRLSSTGVPPIMAGTARNGRASSVANRIKDDDVSPDAMAVLGIPARVSIWY